MPQTEIAPSSDPLIPLTGTAQARLSLYVNILSSLPPPSSEEEEVEWNGAMRSQRRMGGNDYESRKTSEAPLGATGELLEMREPETTSGIERAL